jgi:hypothetical protein
LRRELESERFLNSREKPEISRVLKVALRDMLFPLLNQIRGRKGKNGWDQTSRKPLNGNRCFNAQPPFKMTEITEVIANDFGYLS